MSQIEAHAPNKEPYALIAKVVNVGVALLVYGRDDGVARYVTDVETTWTGCGPLYLGNKGAVGVRFHIKSTEGTVGETYTYVCIFFFQSGVSKGFVRFVNCHLTAHQHKLKQRLADYQHIVSTLLFSPVSPNSKQRSTLYETSHLFLLGDLNFRLEIPSSHPLCVNEGFAQAIDYEKTREELREFDQLTVERRKGTVFVGLREGDFWRFKCSYKYQLGAVDTYE